MSEEEKCSVFCDKKKIENIKNRIIHKGGTDKKWSAFIPDEPEIFGHIIVTYLNPDKHENCIRDITSAEEGDQKILNSLIEGVRIISNKMTNIDNVDRVYVVLAGEDRRSHIHFHLFPRYGFLNNNEIVKWAEKCGISEGEIDWRRFYANPTKDFKFRHDFSYLGEIQQKYDDWKTNKMNGKPPSNELLIEMKDILKGRLKV